MMAPTHLAATLLAAYAMARFTPWDTRTWMLALAFGVLIDVDHALNLPRYLAESGLAGLNVPDMLHYGSAWQGPMHGPWGALVALAACALFRSPVPAAFWGLHMFMDFQVARAWVPWGSAQEWMVLGALGACLAAVASVEARWVGDGAGPVAYWAARARAALVGA